MMVSYKCSPSQIQFRGKGQGTSQDYHVQSPSMVRASASHRDERPSKFVIKIWTYSTLNLLYLIFEQDESIYFD